jgi:hypothetical protein
MVDVVHCPGRYPSFWAVRHPARPYKSVIEKIYYGERWCRLNAPRGPGQESSP